MELLIHKHIKSISRDKLWNYEDLTSFIVDKENPYFSSLDGVLFNKDFTELIFVPLSKEGTLVIPDTVTTLYDNSFYHTSLSEVYLPPLVSTLEPTSDEKHKGLFCGAKNLQSIHFTNNALNVRQYWFLNKQYTSEDYKRMTHLFETCLLKELYPNQLSSSYFNGRFTGYYNRPLILKILLENSEQNLEWCDKWCKYLKRNITKFFDFLLENQDYLIFALKHSLFTLDNTKDMINLCTEKGLHEATALLLDYQNKTFSSEEIISSTTEELFLDTNSKKYISKSWNYHLKKDGTYIITRYIGEDREVLIPDNIDGKPVTELGDDVFNARAKGVEYDIREKRKHINSIIMPNTITKIGKRVFWYCQSLSHLELSSSLKSIGEGNKWRRYTVGLLFECNNLRELEIPTGVEKLEKYALANCLWLESIKLPESLKEIGNYCFLGCGKLESINIPKQITKIPHTAFSGCKNLKIKEE